MKGKKLLAAFMAALMTIGLVPAVAFAEEAKEIYVSAKGSDESGNGSEGNPYASLAKAADVINKSRDDDFIIYVMSDLTSTACARFYNKNVTITSGEGEGSPYTVTRGDNFEPQQDNARSTYNPAMIEVGGTKTDDSEELGKASLRLENITLNDAGKHEGTKFQFAKTDGKGGNTDCVQDSIIASYNGTGTIILGKGTTLKNFGGMSAIYITDSGKLIMEDGSKICDDTSLFISEGTPNEGEIKRVDRGLSAVWLSGKGAQFYMQDCAKIVNLRNAIAVNADGTYSEKGDIEINGEISGLINTLGDTPSVRQKIGGTVILGETGKVIDNTCAFIGGFYVSQGSTLYVYGEISRNKATNERGGGIYLINGTGGDAYCYVEEGSLISGNSSSKTGGGIMVNNGGHLIMNGGTISNNHAGQDGGGVEVRRNGTFIMNGGTIENNTADGNGNGICLDANNNVKLAGYFQLNDGLIKKNDIAIKSPGYAHLDTKNGFGEIGGKVEIDTESKTIDFETDSKTIVLDDDSMNTKMGNASETSISSLKADIISKGWNESILATFWAQRNGSATMKLGGLTIDSNLPVYVMTQKTDETGIPEDNAEIKVYRAEISDGKCCFTIPAVDLSDDGCAVAIVQPRADYGNVVITGPDEIVEDESAESYDVDYKAVYTMSDSFINMLKQDNIPERVDAEFTFTVKLDSRLKAKSGEGEYKFTSDIFDIKDFDVIDEGSTIVARCSLKDGWKASLDKPVTMTLTGTGVLSADNFEEGGILATSGEIDVLIPEKQLRIVIPGNVAETKMVGIKRYTVTFDEGSHGTIDEDDIEKTVTGGKTVGRVPDVEPDDGYKFIGWKIDDEGKLLSDDDVADYTVTGNITFVAQYEKKNSDSGYELPEKHIERPEEKPELETKEHFQYISGYPDGTVRPNANITRAEVATIFYRLLSDDSRNAYFSTVENFSDVQNTDWFLKAVATLTNAGILHGDEGKDTYRPNDSITRAEFATIVSFFDDLSYTGEDRFSDIAGHWANAYINSASANGWISGYPNGTFNPDAAITRAEAMTIINNVLGREVDGEGLHWKTKMWPDNPNYAWFYYEVLEATNYHDYVRESEDEAEEWTDIRPNKVWNEGAAN